MNAGENITVFIVGAFFITLGLVTTVHSFSEGYFLNFQKGFAISIIAMIATYTSGIILISRVKFLEDEI